MVVLPSGGLSEQDELATGDDDLEESPSIIVETRVKPNDIPDYAKKIALNQKQDTTIEKNNFPVEEFWSQTEKQEAPRTDYTLFPQEEEEILTSKPITDLTEGELESSSTIATTTVNSISKNKTATSISYKQDTIDLPVMNLPQKEIFSFSKITMRRPTQPVPMIMQNKPQLFQQPTRTMLLPLHLINSRPFLRKKPYYPRPMYKTPALTRPVRMPYPAIAEKPVFSQNSIKSHNYMPQNIILMKPQLLPFTFGNHVKSTKEEPPAEEISQITPTTPTVTHIEISPQQASTEKEPDLEKSKLYAPLLSIKPSPITYKLPPARNTGFRPESVVIESGFKPIVSQEIQDRKDDSEEAGPEIENEGEIGVINVSTEKDMDNSPTLVETFEPIFVPSPLDKFTQRKPTKMRKRANVKKNHVIFVIKQSRSIHDDEALSDDEIAEAAERVDSYYLPPPDKKLKPSQVPLKPLDIDIPPGTVVTYDGKKVSTASLTMKVPERAIASESRVSKAAELIKSSPQFVPFKGDLPPLDPRFVNTDVPQLKSRAGLSRDLDAPSLPTRLSVVRQLEDIVERRKKREAHHTPEHTAEQNLARQKQEGIARNSAKKVQTMSSFALLLICLLTIL